MTVAVVLVLLSLGALVFASDAVVHAGRALARHYGVSPLVVGLTITSIGTSLPEVATNVAAGLSGQVGEDASGVAVGNVLGSNIGLLTLLLGITGILAPLTTPARVLERDGRVMVGALLAMGLLSLDGTIGRVDGALLLGAYAAYMAWLVAARGEDLADAPDEEPEAFNRRRTAVELVGGLLLVLVSANVMVQNGVFIAETVGVPAVLVGLGVGIGTGLPELAVAVRSVRSDPAMALGNLLGSAITNPLLALGSGALVYPVVVDPEVLRFDWVYTLVCTLIALLLLREDTRLGRHEAGALLMLFVLFAWLRGAVIG